MPAKSVYVLALVGTLVGACGCCHKVRPSGPQSAGETARAEGRLKIEQGDLMVEGERMVVEGRARKARGDALVEQGRRIAGARAARKGELLVRWGEAMIEVAREMETEIGPPAEAGAADERTVAPDDED